MILNTQKITDTLTELLTKNDLLNIRFEIETIKNNIESNKSDLINTEINKNIILIDLNFVIGELTQILETQTIERTKYYIQRLIKSFTEVKTSKINDINLHRWKEYDDLITDSLWVLEKRDTSGAHNASYWGNFVPQIPNQLLRRYTKKNEWILDTFLGSGTTLIECKRLGRNGIGVDINPDAVEIAKINISKEPNASNIKTEIITADNTIIDYEEELKKNGIEKVQFIIMHPPYWDIIKFSDNPNDFSNASNIDVFLKQMEQLVEKSYKILDKNRYCALIMGDKYSQGEWIPLAFYTMQEFLKKGYKLKSIIVKNFDETKGKRNQKELWRYRALVGGFYIFKHEYIFLFKK